jgi:hypothetical protein
VSPENRSRIEAFGFGIGDRVELRWCSDGKPGTVLDFTRGKVCVRFDDLDDATWVLKPTSLRLVTSEGVGVAALQSDTPTTGVGRIESLAKRP